MTTPAALDRTGLLQGLGAYLIWGLLPLYFLMVAAVPAGEILAARIAWSLLFVAVLVSATRGWGALRRAVATPGVVRLLAISAALISMNWLTYIWAVQNHHVTEASLGYFLNPLVNVLLGVAVLGERLTRLQLAAIAFAAAGVAVLASGGTGAALWITAVLAVSFGLYGLVRKTAPVAALEGLAIETALLFPLAIAYLLWLTATGNLGFASDPGLAALLAASGVLTAVPLLLFASAARRLPLSILGLLQYLAPTIQFVLAITAFGEQITQRHILCFALIWTGVALFTASLLRRPLPA